MEKENVKIAIIFSEAVTPSPSLTKKTMQNRFRKHYTDMTRLHTTHVVNILITGEQIWGDKETPQYAS